MIDLSQCTQEQLYGLAFATQKANEEIDAFNASQLEDAPARERYTIQSYADARVCDMLASYWKACNESGLALVTDVWQSLPPQTQNQLKSQLGVGNVIADEYLAQLPSTDV